MLNYDEALAKLLARVAVHEPVNAPLLDALGLVLAHDVATPYPLPPFDNSAMDGYAVRYDDVRNAGPNSPVPLTIAGEISAGAPADTQLTPGTAFRIMTGAPMPDGADTVVPFEDTEAEDGTVLIRDKVEARQFVRYAGGDVPKGTVVVKAGTVIRARNIGLLASAGRAEVRVHPRPNVAVISTGDELVEPGAPLFPGQIYNSNRYSIAAQVREAGGEVVQLSHARDNEPDLSDAFERCRDCDIIITSGGVSVGSYDYVKAVFEERGTLDFWRVAIRPGKPFAFGEWGKTLFFGLPGNPVSSMVTFELFVRPAIRKMLGFEEVIRPIVTVALMQDVSHEPGRRDFQRAIVERAGAGHVASLTGAQGSGMLTSMAAANALLIVPEDAETLYKGESAEAMLLGNVT